MSNQEQQSAEDRTRELSTLLDISHEIASTLDLEQLLPSLFDHFWQVVDYDSVVLSMIESDEEFRWLEHQGPLSDFDTIRLARWRPGEYDLEIVQNLARLREPLIIPDVWADTPEAENWRRNAQMGSGQVPENAGCWMAVPLVASDRPIGILSFLHRQPGYYTVRAAELALALANHAAVAIENARLYQLEQRRAQQLRSIAEVSHQITGVLALDELANRAATLIQQVLGYYHVHIGLIEGDAVVFRPEAGVWREEQQCYRCGQHRFQVGKVGAAGRVAASGEPLVIHDVQHDERYLVMDEEQTGSALILPLTARGETIGVLNIESDHRDDFQEMDVGVLQPLANQLAVALANARLYEQAQKLAKLQERQKLARELHDSISQALYGIGLGTRTALAMLGQNGTEEQVAGLRQPLEYVLSLATTGLAEMRALIFELRPESLEVEGLVAALSRRLDVFRARHDFHIEAALALEPELTVGAKEALYRVALEALHNVVKHADAQQVVVALKELDGVIVLEVRDDGRGFDPKGSFPGHLGLRSMRERVEDVGGTLVVESAPGTGTTVRARVPVAGDD